MTDFEIDETKENEPGKFYLTGIESVWFSDFSYQFWHKTEIEKKLNRKFNSYGDALLAIRKWGKIEKEND